MASSTNLIGGISQFSSQNVAPKPKLECGQVSPPVAKGEFAGQFRGKKAVYAVVRPGLLAEEIEIEQEQNCLDALSRAALSRRIYSKIGR